MDNKNDNNAWIFFVIFTVALLALKVSGILNVPWIWVFAPIWIPAIVVIVCIVALVILVALIGKGKKDTDSTPYEPGETYDTDIIKEDTLCSTDPLDNVIDGEDYEEVIPLDSKRDI